ncbi:MAG: NAD(P)/FAD-dependent oxidoreductase, partial [Oscillospiraceae bacterium]|nr:NAD(P)/FAD-dependent oxidoreductase [Oscillospiraceae bacterium]
IVATGGCAAPAHGSNGSGLDLLRSLGHPIVAPKPALVPLTAQSPVLPLLQGLRTRGTITLARHTAAGEILFTEDGLSGIAAMEVSRNATPGAIASLDLLPEFSPEALTAIIGRWQSECPEMGLAGLLPRRVGEAVCKAAHAPADVAATCKDFRFTITGTREFPFAQVTAGGADVAAFDPHTLESRLVPGLFACGEALDVDGGCGGFNLHWAWASALLLK